MVIERLPFESVATTSNWVSTSADVTWSENNEFTPPSVRSKLANPPDMRLLFWPSQRIETFAFCPKPFAIPYIPDATSKISVSEILWLVTSTCHFRTPAKMDVSVEVKTRYVCTVVKDYGTPPEFPKSNSSITTSPQVIPQSETMSEVVNTVRYDFIETKLVIWGITSDSIIIRILKAHAVNKHKFGKRLT